MRRNRVEGSSTLKNQVRLFLGILILACGCARNTELAKYNAYTAELGKKTAHGEIAEVEAAHLKMQAYKEYLKATQHEERDAKSGRINQETNLHAHDVETLLRKNGELRPEQSPLTVAEPL